MESLVHVASDITKLKLMEDELRLSREKYQAIFESAGDGIIYIDNQAVVQDVNPALSRITGTKKEDIVGRSVAEITKVLFPGKQARNLVRRIKPLLEGIPLEPIELEIGGRYIEISESVSGSTHGITGIVRDVTERKKTENHIRDSLQEKEVLLQEIHHRVKNNMQIISSLLRLQSESIRDQMIREKFEISRSRIRSMALIHETLYQSQNFAKVKFSDYIRKMTSHLFAIYADKSVGIEINLDLEDILLEINTAIPCGLILNELLSNALIHTFPVNNKGKITVRFHQSKNQIIKLIITDNGIGMDKGQGVRSIGSLGLQLVGDLVKQINGRIIITRQRGTMFSILFPQS